MSNLKNIIFQEKDFGHVCRLCVWIFLYFIILFFTILKIVNIKKKLFLKLCLDGLENLRQNWIKLNKTLGEFKLTKQPKHVFQKKKKCNTQTCPYIYIMMYGWSEGYNRVEQNLHIFCWQHMWQLFVLVTW
jgi:hypothetical protein